MQYIVQGSGPLTCLRNPQEPEGKPRGVAGQGWQGTTANYQLLMEELQYLINHIGSIGLDILVKVIQAEKSQILPITHYFVSLSDPLMLEIL